MRKRRSEPALPALPTIEEFLLEESRSSGRREYLNGRVLPVLGARYNRSVITSNLISIIRPHLRKTTFTVHSSVFKVRANDVNCVLYADVFVQTEKLHLLSSYSQSPVVIAEVLSPERGRFNDDDKLALCKQIPTLQEYLRLSETWPHIELHRLNPRGYWDTFDFTEGMYVNINAMPGEPLVFPVEAVYEDADIHDDQIDTGSELYARDDEDPDIRDRAEEERI